MLFVVVPLMAKVWEIAADEAFTHQTPPLNRYWCFFGGVCGSEAVLDRLEKRLENVVATFGCRSPSACPG